MTSEQKTIAAKINDLESALEKCDHVGAIIMVKHNLQELYIKLMELERA